MGLEVARGRRRRRRSAPTPATCWRGSRAAERRREHPALRPHGHGAAGRAGRAGARRRRLGERQRGHPRRRQQVRGRDPRSSSPGGSPRRRAARRSGSSSLFTVCEEVSLRGSREFDVSRAAQRFGYVFDHATPIGEVVVASPTHYRIVGRAPRPRRPRRACAPRRAAARSSPPPGRSPRCGSAGSTTETTANVGMIAGRHRDQRRARALPVVAEVRSLDDARAAAVTTETIDHLQDAADAGECDLDLNVEQMFQGYRHPAGAPQVAVAERALARLRLRPERIVSGGASDVNSFMVDRLRGLPADGVRAQPRPRRADQRSGARGHARCRARRSSSRPRGSGPSATASAHHESAARL